MPKKFPGTDPHPQKVTQFMEIHPKPQQANHNELQRIIKILHIAIAYQL